MANRDDDTNQPSAPPTTPTGVDRRRFLQQSAIVGLGGLAWWPGCGREPEGPGVQLDGEPHIRRRNVLGRSGIEIPDISFGTWGLDGQDDVVRHALARGITHFDTAPDYADGKAEETIGRALAGDRQRVTIATKYVAPADASRQQIMEHLESSLRRLGTDYVDIFFNHAVNQVERIRNPEWIEFVALAKQQGKIRASGMSAHAGHLTECVEAALEDDATDVFLLAHNYANEPGFWGVAHRLKDVFTGGFDVVGYHSELPRLMRTANERNLGVMVMKTRRGARYNDLTEFKRDGATQYQAAFRWVLSNPDVHGLTVTMWEKAAVDSYVAVSGSGPPTLADTRTLLEYEVGNAGQLCQPGCAACATACPVGVDIAGTLRTRMYAERYGRPEIARSEYAKLESNASPCLTCASPVCVSACPEGIDIPTRTRETHRVLG